MGKTENLLVGPTAELLFIRNYLYYLEYYLNYIQIVDVIIYLSPKLGSERCDH